MGGVFRLCSVLLSIACLLTIAYFFSTFTGKTSAVAKPGKTATLAVSKPTSVQVVAKPGKTATPAVAKLPGKTATLAVSKPPGKTASKYGGNNQF